MFSVTYRAFITPKYMNLAHFTSLIVIFSTTINYEIIIFYHIFYGPSNCLKKWLEPLALLNLINIPGYTTRYSYFLEKSISQRTGRITLRFFLS